MPLHNTPSTPQREAEIKPIDYNDSIRSTYFTIDELRECGAALARDGVSSLPGFFPFEFRPRHRENENEIFRVYKVTATDVEAGASITPAAEWLLDNHYLVEESIQEVRRDFPRKFFASCRPCRLPAQQSRARWRSPGSMWPIPTARCRAKA